MLALILLAMPALAASAAQIDIPQPGSQIEIPTIEVPEVQIPEVTLPEIPEVTVPEVPTVEIPTVEVPEVEIPTVEVPTIEVPTVEVPTVEVPTVEVPSALETCQAQFPDGVSNVSTMVEDALADSGLPADLVAQIVELASAGDLTCADLFPA